MASSAPSSDKKPEYAGRLVFTGGRTYSERLFRHANRKSVEGKKVNKAFHRKALLPLLDNRTEGSLEYKYQNISAVLINL